MMLYTVRFQVVHGTKRDFTGDGPWSSQNVTGFEYHANLAADKRYTFAVTAWNRWGESLLEGDKAFVLSTNFTSGITLKSTDILQTGKNSNDQSHKL